jgi:hypothetical protein
MLSALESFASGQREFVDVNSALQGQNGSKVKKQSEVKKKKGPQSASGRILQIRNWLHF